MKQTQNYDATLMQINGLAVDSHQKQYSLLQKGTEPLIGGNGIIFVGMIATSCPRPIFLRE